MSYHDKLLSRNLGKAYTATSLGVEVDGIDPMPENPTDPADPPVEEIPETEPVNPYDPFAFDRGVKVKFYKSRSGIDPAEPNKGKHIEAYIYLTGVGDWGGIVAAGEGGYNAFQIGVTESVELGEMTISTFLSVAADHLTIKDDDVITKEVAGGFGDQDSVVLSDGFLIRLDWYNIPDSVSGPVTLTLGFSLSDTDNGFTIDGITKRVPHYPRNPSLTVVLP